MYQPLNPDTAGLWGKPRFTYLPLPLPHILTSHKRCLQEQDFHTLYIIISPYIHNTIPLMIYQCSLRGQMIHKGCIKGINYMQAICRAVYDALNLSLPLHDGPAIIWLQPKTIPNKILMVKPHRDSHVTFDIWDLITRYLTKYNIHRSYHLSKAMARHTH